MEYIIKESYENSDFKEEYNKLIEFRLNNKLTIGYKEEHHIKPRCFFKDNTSNKDIDKDNLVYLTGQEHFLAHYFLLKIHENDNDKYRCEAMFKAFDIIYKGNDIIECSKLYEDGRNVYYNLMEENGKEKVREICRFMIKHNRKPSKNGEDYERKLNGKITQLIQNKYTDNKRLFFKSYDEISRFYGFRSLFEKVDYEKESLYNIAMICEFKRSYDIFPQRNKNCNYENQLAVYLQRIRRNYKTQDGSFYESYQLMVESYNLENLFIDDGYTQKTDSNINEIINYVNNNGIPLRSNKEKEAIKINNKIRNFRNKRKINDWDESWDCKAIEIGYKYLFYNSESKKLDQIKRLKDYIENNKLPTHKTHKELASIYYGLKTEYKNNKIQQVYVDKLKELEIFELIIGDKK